jgi:hypothetical protein
MPVVAVDDAVAAALGSASTLSGGNAAALYSVDWPLPTYRRSKRQHVKRLMAPIAASAKRPC